MVLTSPFSSQTSYDLISANFFIIPLKHSWYVCNLVKIHFCDWYSLQILVSSVLFERFPSANQASTSLSILLIDPDAKTRSGLILWPSWTCSSQGNLVGLFLVKVLVVIMSSSSVTLALDLVVTSVNFFVNSSLLASSSWIIICWTGFCHDFFLKLREKYLSWKLALWLFVDLLAINLQLFC